MEKDAEATGRTRWICQCDCGTIRSVSATSLIGDTTGSCGCKLVEFCKLKIIDETENRYGRLAVLRLYGTTAQGHKKWLCACDCGNLTIVNGTKLRSGHTSSCGCKRTTHGMSKTPEYNAWNSLFPRCYKETDPAYHRYGGRGIYVCEEWHDFENFYADMGDRPGEKYSIDRIDNDEPYCDWNCRWATKKEQARNRSNNRLHTYDGARITAAEIYETYEHHPDVSLSTFEARLNTHGWSVNDSLSLSLQC